MRAPRPGAPLAGAAVVALLLGAGGAPARAEGESEHIAVAFDQRSGVTTIRIKARGGEIDWSDALKGIARAKGFDDSALDGALPNGAVELGAWRTRLLLRALSSALEPAIELSVAKSRQRGGEPSLVLRLDRAALLASERRIKNLLQEALSDALGGDDGDFGVELDDRWKRAPRGRDLVLLIHGIDSAPKRTSVTSLRKAIRRRGFPTGVVAYPNDQPIRRSAALLAKELRQIAEAQPGRPVTLVAKSMGGLVARAAIEDPELDPGNVERLIMIGTPNRGSALAHFAFALELWEHVAEKRSAPVRALCESVEDGFGQAGDDLIPGSPFLKELNSRPRNPEVDYTIFLGTGGPLTRGELRALRLAFRRQKDDSRFTRFFGDKLDRYLADLDEVVRGKGDGAVSLERGKLQGVDDVVVLGFDHLGASRTSRELRRRILGRIK